MPCQLVQSACHLAGVQQHVHHACLPAVLRTCSEQGVGGKFHPITGCMTSCNLADLLKPGRMQEVQQSAPLCQALNEDSTMRTMLSLFMPHVRLDSQAIKLQCNAGIAFAVSLPVAEYHHPFSPVAIQSLRAKHQNGNCTEYADLQLHHVGETAEPSMS